MKKLLILAALLLALVLTVVACKGGEKPEVTTGPDVDVTEPATDAPTEEPDVPTEEPTVEPDVPTEEPTKEPDVPTEEPTKEPDVPTEEPTKEPETPTEPPVDPDAPLHTVEPDFLANYAAQTGNMVCCNDLGTTEMLTEAGRTFYRLTSAGGDPYIAFIDGQKQLKIGRYMAVSYRTNSAKIGQFFMGSGDGWNGNGDQFLQDWNEDGNWNLAIIDLDNVGLTALTDYVLNYARLDFFTEAGAEGDYFDVEYIAFFNTAEAAQKYDFEAHKAPMWDADKAVVTHQSFDELTKYLGGAAGAGIFTPGQSAGWDFVADLTDGSADTLRYWGWVGVKGEVGKFGYQINGGTAIYDDAWTVTADDAVKNAAAGTGADTASRMAIMINLAGLEGENSVRVLYKTADGIEVCLNEFVVKMPVLNLQNKFESNVSENADGTDLQASDLSQYFTITYGASEPHVVSGGMYQYGGINELYAMVDGYYAFSVNMYEASNTAMMFVRGTRVVHSVDLPAVDGSLYPINNYYETDGQGRMGGAGIYAALYNGKLNLMIKAYDDETRTHQINRDYAVKAEGTELTIADNGETIYFLVDGKLMATVALSGSTSYEKICDLAEGITFAQTAVVTLADGTTDTIENTLVVSTHKSQVGIAVRPATIKFDSIKVLGFNDVIIPEDFYVPEEKVNIALNKPVSADSTENDQNVPYKMTDGDESTRWGALPNGVANVVVDLEAVYTLSGMDILFENAGWGYEIAISTDGETYEKIYESAGHGGKMVSLEGTVDARYIKFTRTQDDGATHYWFSIYELYVYGTLKGGDEPVGPEAPESIVIDPRDLPAGSITGHMPNIVDSTFTNHYPMIAAAGLTSGAMIHQGSIYIGDYDLNNCTKVVIYYATDWGQGTQDALAAAKEQGFGCLGICAWDNNNIVNPDRNGFVGTQYTPDGGWAITAHEIDVTDLTYAGPVYVSADFLGGQFIIIDRVELVGATKLEPSTPEEPVKPEVLHVSNDELRYLGADLSQIGQAFAPGAYASWDGKITVNKGEVATFVDWGWVAMKNADSYTFGYIINDGQPIYHDLWAVAVPEGDPVWGAVPAGTTAASRFMGTLAEAALNVGENNIKFVVKMNDTEVVVLREYTVTLNEKTVEPEPEDPIGPPPPHEDKVVTLANRNEDGPYITDGSMKFGQKYSVGENILKGISITNMATYSDGSVNTWSFKVWKWNTDYATTTAAEPLFVQTGENHQDNQTFTAIIPADLYITGEFYYEIEYLSGSARFTSWCGDAVVEGLESYTNGVKTDKNYASSLIVGVPLVEDPNFYPTVVIDLSKFADQLGYKPSFPEAGISVPLFDLQYNGFISIGELDLSQYSAVEITYSFDGSDVTLGNYNNASSHAIGLKSEPSSFGQATDDNFSGAIAYTDMEFAGGWTSYKTAVVDLSSVTYNGAVYVTMHNPAGTSIAITGVKFIGAEKPAPHEHSYESVVTAPTCTEAGYTTYTCACGDTYTADEVAATGHTFADGVCSVCGAADPDYVAVKMPAEFVLSLYQGNLGKTLYFIGEKSGNFLAMSENSADAVKVYSEETANGWVMYFMNGDVKTYIVIHEWQAGRNGVELITTEPTTFFQWNEEANTWTVWLEGCSNHYYLGTYNTYNTISSSKISFITGNNAANVGVSQFVAQWADVPAAHEHSYESVVTAPTCTESGYTTYTCACGDSYTADEVAALGHSFADGTCSVCGATDPDYVAPEYYENLIVPQDKWTVSGHVAQIVPSEGHSHSAMVAAGGITSGALIHQGAVGLGDIDLSKYSKVIIYYGIDNSNVTIGHYDANANNRIMLSKVNNHLQNAPADADIIASTVYTLQGWALVTVEIDLTGINYNGPVFVSYDTLPGTFMLIGKVEFIGAEKPVEHKHNYETVVTAPTCTEGGYTTYTCACGDTYTADEVVALGHSFADGVCSVCGAADPDYEAPVVDESSATIVFDSFDCLTDEGDNYKVFANAGLTFTQNQGESTSWNPQYINPVRLYKNHIVTIEFANLNKIVFVVNAAKYVDPLVNSIADDNATVTADGNTVTIEFAAPVDSFTITFTGGQVRVDSITVYAAETSEEEPTVGTSFDDPIVLSPDETNNVELNVTEDGMGDYNNGKGLGVYVTITVPSNGIIYFNPSVDNLDVAEVSVSWNGSLYTEWGTPDSSYSVYAGETYTFLLATRNMKADNFTIEITFEEAQPELYNETEIFVVGSTIEIWPSAANYKAGAWVAIFAQGAEMTAENAIMSFVLDQDQYSFDASALGVGTYVLALITADGVVSDTVDYTVIAKPVTHVSFDQLYAGSGVAGLEGNIFAPGSYATWDGIANVEGMTEFTAWGWTGLIGEIGQFGYIIDGDTWSAVYNDAFAHATEQAVIDAALTVPGTTTASRFKIVIPVIAGTHTVDLVYKNADGIEIIFASFTMTSPKAGDSAENPIYVSEAMTVLDMGANETVYLYFRNPNGMILSTDSYVTIVYNGQEYPASYDLTEIIFTEGIGEGALVAVTAGEWGAYAYLNLSEYVPPVSELPFTTDVSTDGYNPGEITIQAPATGILTMTGGANASFLYILGQYNTEWIGDGTATLNVVEGQTYTIGVTSADWTAATFTVTFTMGEAPAIGDTEIIEGTINVTTTDNNGWFDQYTFVAEVAGTYTFTLPAGLGFYSKAAYDAYGAPEIDFYENASGYSFSIDLAAGESYVFYVGSTEKTDWVISYSCAVDAEGGETPEVPDVPVEPVEDISGIYAAGEGTVEIDAAMGTLVYTFTTGGGVLTTAEYTFEIVDGAVVLSNANGVIADSMAIYFGKLELNANGVPSVFWYNGYDYALTLA